MPFCRAGASNLISVFFKLFSGGFTGSILEPGAQATKLSSHRKAKNPG
jgi:hypothetical protein